MRLGHSPCSGSASWSAGHSPHLPFPRSCLPPRTSGQGFVITSGMSPRAWLLEFLGTHLPKRSGSPGACWHPDRVVGYARQEAGQLCLDSRLRLCWLPGRSRVLSLIPFQVNQPGAAEPSACHLPRTVCWRAEGSRRPAGRQSLGRWRHRRWWRRARVGSRETSLWKAGARAELQGVEAVAFRGRPCGPVPPRASALLLPPSRAPPSSPCCIEKMPVVTTSHRGDELMFVSRLETPEITVPK